MKHITKEDALRALEEAVAEKGEDYVYPDELRADGLNCQYTVDGAPACIVGHALDRLGVDLTVFRGHGHQTTSFGKDLVGALGIPIDDKAQRLLRAAQSSQDSGSAWGVALRMARETVPDA